MKTMSSRLETAIDLAQKHLAGKYRKPNKDHYGLLPYIIHPLEVMKRVWGWGLNEDSQIVAVLHDNVEEGPAGAREDIYNLFGDNIGKRVDKLSFIPDESLSPKEKAEAKKLYIESFRDADIEDLLIKIADRIENVCDFLAVDSEVYSKKYFQKAKPLFDAMQSRAKEIQDKLGRYTLICVFEDYNSLLSKMGSV